MDKSANISSAVDIDNRLTDLFQSRRKKAAESTDYQTREPEVQIQAQDLSWLSQFQVAVTPIPSRSQESESSVNVISTYRVSRSDTRPFWAPSDVKATTQLWKRTRSLLTKDCQKQRKAAIRKTVRRLA